MTGISETVDNYIQSLERTNPKLAEIIETCGKKSSQSKDYQGQSITGVLDTMIEAIIDDISNAARMVCRTR